MTSATAILSDKKSTALSVFRDGKFPMFRALRHRNYRLYFVGQFFSLSGTWIQNIAQSWLVYELTHSSFWLGFIGFLNFLPLSLFAIIAGSFADRISKHKLLLVLQIPPMLLAFLFAALVWAKAITVGWISVLALGFGFVNAFDIPTRQSFVVELVGKEDLANGIALNSATFNTARLLGPAIGGVIIATLGIGWCMFLNGISYFATIWGLLLMRFENMPTPGNNHAPFAHSIREAMLYIRQTRPVYGLLMLVSVTTIFGWSFWILMPVFAGHILHGGALELGKLMSSGGIGALGSALFVAGCGHRFLPRRLLFSGVTIFAVGAAVFALSKTFPLSLVMVAITGFGIILFYVNANSALQQRVPDHLRGRIMGAYALAFGGLTPLGNLQIGFFAEKIGAPAAVVIGAAICALMAYVVSRLIPYQPRAAEERTAPIPPVTIPE
ncbi:MAG: MFS transporter [candidate division KSB1 bacterium]|nr:MFS transporter [candidate division KSB1 bacterium]MDZ7302115.1 MFS transporter [candidate division KSB1 bacterium]MDZ7311156.1 MFS transporter [candidate division KSB1 bacterium]